MKLSGFLNDQAVSTALKSTSRSDVLKELVALLEKAHGVKTGGEILKRVTEREAMMSTGIGNGVAIPHGKAKSIDNLLASCGIAPKGIEFQAVDQQPVTLFILLVSPEECRGPHVRALANISRLLREEHVREGLKKAPTARKFLEILKEAEAKYL